MAAIFQEEEGTWRVEVDATVAEDHQANALITTHAVEKGANVADHVVPGNVLLTLDVSVTDTPIRVPSTQSDGVQRTSQDVVEVEHVETDGKGQVTSREFRTYKGLALTGPLTRVTQVHQAFIEQWRRATTIQVETSTAIYPSCVIRSVGLPRRAQSSVVFKIVVEQLRFANSKTVEALPPKPKKPNGKPKINRGTKPTQQRNDGDGGLQASFAAKVTGRGT